MPVKFLKCPSIIFFQLKISSLYKLQREIKYAYSLKFKKKTVSQFIDLLLEYKIRD